VSLTTLREKVVKIGAKVAAHARYTVFRMAEVAVPRELFHRILDLIDELRPRQVVDVDAGSRSAHHRARRKRCARGLVRRAGNGAVEQGGPATWGGFRQEARLLMLFRAGTQGYSALEACQSVLNLGNVGLGLRRHAHQTGSLLRG
jgi:hypothetical protein